MGMLDKAKNAAKTTKLKGEIALLDRDIKAKKQKFGIEVSDLLWDMEAKQKALGGRESVFLTSLRTQWDVAKADLQKTREKKEEIQSKLDAAGELKRSGEQDDASAMDKAKAVGTEGKRRAKLQLLDRELKSRKQQFGIDVYDAAVEVVQKTAPASAGGLTDAKNQGAQSAANAVDKTKLSFVEKQLAKAAISTVSKGLNQLTVSDQDLLKCIQTVQTEVETLQQKKDTKRNEIEQLKQPTTWTIIWVWILEVSFSIDKH